LIATGHTGRANSGLIAAWDKGNAQGAWDAGLRPSEDLAADLAELKALYIVGADPVADHPELKEALEAAEFVVVQELMLTETAKQADVVLPAQAFTEREGSFTNAERRVQRYYPAVPAVGRSRPDFAITAQIAKLLGLELEDKLLAKAFANLAAQWPAYDGVTYGKLAEVHEQWPIIGHEDVYYGGTTYNNSQGLGVQLPSGAERGESPALSFEPPAETGTIKGLKAVPVTVLYDRGAMVTPSTVIASRLENPQVVLSPADADKLGLEMGASAKLTLNGSSATVSARIDNSLSKGTALVPRSLGIPIHGPTEAQVEADS
jgi:NADH-quinone oxidoreductase subunit G